MLTACGIETHICTQIRNHQNMYVATAPTACGMYHLNSIKPRENHLDLLGVFVS